MTAVSGSKKPTALEEELRLLIIPIAQYHGLELFDLGVMRRAQKAFLRLVIDKLEGEVSIEDCERLSRHAELIIDEAGILGAKYSLEVSSPGLDRPLRHMADVRRFIGRLAHAVFGSGKPCSVTGILESTEGDNIALRDEEGNLIVRPWEEVTRARLEVEMFRPPSDKHKRSRSGSPR